MIIVVGLGNRLSERTAAAANAVKNAKTLYTRTFLSEPSKDLKAKNAVSFDELFEKAKDFNELYNDIALKIIDAAKVDDVTYCVDGDAYSDNTVIILYELARKNNIDIQIIAGLTLGAKQPASSCLSIGAYELLTKRPLLDSNIPLLINGIDNPLLAGEVKLYLLEFYPPSQTVLFSYNGKETVLSLEDTDRQSKYNYSASFFINETEGFNKERYTFSDLLKVMEKLTAKDGCEWDKAQTHSSIRVNLIEEAYEAVDAIDSGDITNMIEEVGDVMLQSVFHSDIAKRSGEFTFGDVSDALCKKLISRHTHIFGENKADNAVAALNFWEAAKAKEKNQKSLSDTLDSIPQIFPSALRAQKAIKKAVKAGLKLDAAQIKDLLKGAADNKDIAKLLFLCVAYSVCGKKDAEVELNGILNTFIENCKKENDLAKKELTDLL